MDDYVEATQAMAYSDYGEEETDEEVDKDKSVGFLKVSCQKGFPDTVFPLYEGDNMIGRHDSCSITIPLKALSREHACIEINGDSHLIYDKGSRNRTRRNKHFLKAEVRYELKDRDVLVFGDVQCVYRLQDQKSDDETGSETGSESCFQTAPLGETLNATENVNQSSKSKLPLDPEEEDGFQSDASSDILEPTQPFDANSQMLKMSSTASTDNWNRSHSVIVKDTPAPSKSKRFTENLMVPESDEDTDDEAVAGRQPIAMAKLAIADSQDVDDSGDKTALMGLATQAYVCESDVDTGDEKDSPRKRALLSAATQAYVDDDASTHSEDSPVKRAILGAATQAYTGDTGTDTEGEQVRTRPRRRVQIEPTCEYEMGRGIEPTMAYDMGDDEADDSKSKSMMYEPTQAYHADGDAEVDDSKSKSMMYEPTQAYDADADDDESKDSEVTASKSRGLLYEPTQAYDAGLGEGHKTTKGRKYDSDTSEEFVLEGDLDAKEDLEDVSHLFMAPTLACGMDDDPGTDTGQESDDGETKTAEFDATDATQAIGEEVNDNKSHLTDATQVFENDSTQVFDDQPKSARQNLRSGNKRSNKANNDATQVFDNDATQVFDDQPKCRKDKITNRKSKETDADSTQVFDDIDATQVFDENSGIRKERKSADNTSSTQVIDDDTQVIDENFHQQVGKQQEIATQVFDDATQVIDDVTSETVDSTEKKDKADSEEATQNFDSPDLGKEVSFDINAASTLAVDEPIIPVSTTVKGRKVWPANDATQVFDEAAGISEDGTVAVTDDSTMDVTEADPTIAVKETNVVTGKHRNQRGQQKTDAKANDATQVFDETVNVTENDSTVDVTDATLAVPECEEKVTRAGKKRGQKEQLNVALTANDATQVFDATLAVTEHEEKVNTKIRKTKATKQTRSKASPYDTEDTQVIDATVGVSELDATMAITEPDSDDKEPTKSIKKGRNKHSPYMADDATQVLEDETLTASNIEPTVAIDIGDTLDIAEATDPVPESKDRPKRGRRCQAIRNKDNKKKPSGENLQLNDCGDNSSKAGDKSDDLEQATQAYGKSPMKAGLLTVEQGMEPETQIYGKSPEKCYDLSGDDLEPATQIYGMSPLKSPIKLTPRKKDLGDDLEPATQMYGISPLKSPLKLTLRKKGLRQSESDIEPETQIYGMSPGKITPESNTVVSKTNDKVPEQSKSQSNVESVKRKGRANKNTKLNERKTDKNEKDVEDIEGVKDAPKVLPAVTIEPTQGRRSGRSKGRRGVDGEKVGEATKTTETEGASRRGRRNQKTERIEEKNIEEVPVRGRRSIKQTRKAGSRGAVPPVAAPTPGTSGIETELIIPSQDDDATPPLSQETIPDSQDTITSPIIPKPKLLSIPSRSPLKSALASPERKKSPSPKRVQFVSQGSNAGSQEAEAPTGRGRRGKKQPVTKKEKGQDKDKVVSVEAEVEKGKENSFSENSKVPSTRHGKSSRGRETVIEQDESKNVGRRGRRSLPGKHVDQANTVGSSHPTSVKEEPEIQPNTDLNSDELNTGDSAKGKNSKTVNAKRTTKGRGKKTVNNAETETSLIKETDSESVPAIASATDDLPGRRSGRGKGTKVREEVTEDIKPQNVRSSRKATAGDGKTSSVSGEVQKETTEVKETGRGSRRSKTAVKQEVQETVLKTEKDPVDEIQNENKRTIENERAGTSHVKAEDHSVESSIGIVGSKRTRRGKGETVDKDSLDSTIISSTRTKGNISQISVKESESTPPDDKISNKRSARSRGSMKKDTTEEAKGSTEGKHGDVSTNKKASRKNIDKDDNTLEEKTAVSEANKRKSRNKVKDKVEEKVDISQMKGKQNYIKESEQQSTSTSGNRTTRHMLEEKQNAEDVTVSKAVKGRKKGKSPATPDSQESQTEATPAKKQKTKAIPAATPQSTNHKAEPHAAPKSATRKVESSIGTPKGAGKKMLESPLPSSPSLRKTTIDGHKPHVMFTGVTDEQGEKIVKDLGGVLVNSVHECTHLVTDQIRRTVKFLCCVSRGLPIVTPQWLVSSKRTSMFADPTPFLLKDYASEKKHKFTLQRSLDKASDNALLAGYSIHVTKSVKPDPGQMKDILQSAGAKYLAAMPKAAGERTLVMSCDDDRGQCEAAVRAGVTVVSAEFVLTGILRQEVDIASYQLFGGNGRKRQAAASEPDTTAKRRKR